MVATQLKLTALVQVQLLSVQQEQQVNTQLPSLQQEAAHLLQERLHLIFHEVKADLVRQQHVSLQRHQAHAMHKRQSVSGTKHAPCTNVDQHQAHATHKHQVRHASSIKGTIVR